jgi:N-methylhydantoinase B
MTVTAHQSDVVTYRSPVLERAFELPEADAVTTEVIRHGLNATAAQMQGVLRRAAFSPVIYEMIDFCCAIYDRDVRLLAQGMSLPSWLGTMGFCIESVVNAAGGPDAIREGDVLFSTYGYDLGSHPQDAAVVLPVFYRHELIAYAAVKAHQMDIGAAEFYCTDTTDNFQEGTIFPGVRLFKGGVRDEELWRMLLANSRLPNALAGDVSASIASAEAGARGIVRLLDQHGQETFLACVERMFDHGEAVVRRIFEQIPDGRYEAHGALDSNGVTDDLIPFDVTIEVDGSEITVDFTAAPAQQAGPTNSPHPTTVSCARYTMMFLMGAHAREFVNEGHFRSITVKTRPGSMFHALPPAPIFLYSWPTRIACDAMHRAMAEAMPANVMAGTGNDPCAVVCWGTEDDGQYWATGFDHSVGQGATVDGDGPPPLMVITNSGIRMTPAEVIEARFPFVVRRFELAPDSGGAGRYRGGPGLDLHYEALADSYWTVPFERTKTPPWGLFGGRDGRPNRFRVVHPDGRVEEMGKATRLPVPKGSIAEVETGGGGGYGPPGERDAAAVLGDVREGYLSEAAARAQYPHAFAEPD